jgi:aryl-alcohol dehydrogenase-like predicted oxidoreductase
MRNKSFDSKRRDFIKRSAGLALSLGLAPGISMADEGPSPITRKISKSDEVLPVIGMGTWQTFNVGDDINDRGQRVQVLRAFFDRGGALIDSSPMYGSAEEVLGYCLPRVDNREKLFAATKVWTPGQKLGISQMERSYELWGLKKFDLMQVHNLVDWEDHLQTLKQWKREGKIRYIGVTTSHGRRHEELEKIMLSEPIDFVQFTYNLVDREAEQRLLPLAAEKGLAVIINRPFDGGDLFDRIKGKALPEWAREFDCTGWAQFFLKFIVSHPAVTCAIPATSSIGHMLENMGALYGRLPDAAMRQRMLGHFEKL